VSIDNLTATMGAAVAAAGTTGIGVPTITKVVSLLPSGQAVPLSPTNTLPPTFIQAYGSPAQQPGSPHHPQMGIVPAACLPVTGAIFQQPLTNVAATGQSAPCDDYYLPPNIHEVPTTMASLALSQARHYHNAPMNDTLANQPHFTYQPTATATATTSSQSVLKS